MPRPRIKIALGQLDPIVGDFAGNRQKLLKAYEWAAKSGARFVMTPELSLCGYPPHDLLERPEFFERTDESLKILCEASLGFPKTALIAGWVARNPKAEGRGAFNVAGVIENGKIVFTQAKTLLPTYDVFDEARYFEPAAESSHIWNCDGLKIAIAICEDLWASDQSYGRKLYGHDPVEKIRSQKPALVLSVSSSPYEFGKREKREELHAEVAKRIGAPLIYVNQVGANDELLFDGQSFAVTEEGDLGLRLKGFSTDFGVIDLDELGRSGPIAAEKDEMGVLVDGLIVGIRSYFERSHFKKAILGISGGIDSAVVAVLATLALGKENVTGVAMPSQHSSGHSLEDAEILARGLGIKLEVRPIKFMYSTVSRECADGRGGKLEPIAQENLQSRLRGVILMTLSNHDGALVLTTGNKSEIAVGYCTLYGDMAGALAPIGDLFKTQVYALARALNPLVSHAIPERTFTKAPSAELRPGQTDQDSLPPYDQLDAVLSMYLERNLSFEAIESEVGVPWVRDIAKKVEAFEFKRRQGAPVLKVSTKAFGLGRRMPIAKVWN